MKQERNTYPPHPSVKKHLQNGVDFSNEILDFIEEITYKYNVHVSQSVEMGHFEKIDKSMTRVCKNLIEYKARHIRLLDQYDHFEKEYSYPSTSGS
tara:strand:- start:2339 stop:2626 length:288 start_codon:yes stop_codon:yes gene_type:complete